MKAIDVINELHSFLRDKIAEICKVNKIDYELHFSSNLNPNNSIDKLRIYLTRRIIREDQDTLAVDVEDFGRKRYTSEGVYAISFLMPKTLSGGYLKLETIAQTLKNELRQKRFDCLWVRHITASPQPIESNSYEYVISFSYEFDEFV